MTGLRPLMLAVSCAAVAACTDRPGAAHPPRPDADAATPPLPLAGAVVRGASNAWYVDAPRPPRYGDPVPVIITAYCLGGTTRRGRYVRPGIVAADPQLFPLARYLELFKRNGYLGRYLVDDTGDRIRGPRIDLWMPTCREARAFGVQRGIVVLVAKPIPDVRLAGEPQR